VTDRETGQDIRVSFRKKLIFCASEKVVAGVGLVRDRGRPSKRSPLSLTKLIKINIHNNNIFYKINILLTECKVLFTL
jgi:hypothetical protein